MEDLLKMKTLMPEVLLNVAKLGLEKAPSPEEYIRMLEGYVLPSKNITRASLRLKLMRIISVCSV